MKYCANLQWQYVKSAFSRGFAEPEKYYIFTFGDFFFFLRDCTFNITNDGSVIKKDPSSYVFVWEKIPQKIYSTLLTARTTVGLVVNYAVSIGSVSIANNCRNNFTGPACTCRVCPHVLVYQNCLRLCNFLRRNAAWENTKVNFKFIDIAFRTDRNSEIVQ